MNQAKQSDRFFQSAVFAVVAVLAFLGSTPVFADTEPPLQHDARSVGMGGTGTAFIDSPAATLYNPANLDGTHRYSLMVSLTPGFGVLEAPFAAGPGPVEQVDSSLSVIPLFFLGGAVRLEERVTVGLAAYTLGGIGGKYQDIDSLGGQDLDLVVALGEVAMPIAFQINEALQIGASFRLGFALQQSDVLNPASGMREEQDSFAFGAPGLQLGLTYRPIPILSLAVTYRSKMKFEPEGELTSAAGTFDVDSEWYSPHALRFGTALSLMEERLLLAFDLKFQFYDESHNVIPTRVEGEPVPRMLVLNWKDTTTVMLGGEYKFTEQWAGRLGYAVGTSATAEATASAFFPPPGVLHAFTAGAGVTLDRWELGLALAYSFSNYELTQPSVNGAPGDYGADQFYVALSGVYRH